jgi:hypothetical protein
MTEYSNIHKEVKNSTRRDRRILCDEQAKKAVEVVSKGNMKKLYHITKLLGRKKVEYNSPVRNKEGILLRNEEEEINRKVNLYKYKLLIIFHHEFRPGWPVLLSAVISSSSLLSGCPGHRLLFG